MPRALVLGRQYPGDTEASVGAALDELENLLAQLEIRVVATVIQRQRSADPTISAGNRRGHHGADQKAGHGPGGCC